MGVCTICHRCSDETSEALALCAECIRSDSAEARQIAIEAHARSRAAFGLPDLPPRSPDGLVCRQCVNACALGAGQTGYCGVRRREGDRISGGDRHGAVVMWYHDPLPTNCVADWVCPASGSAGYPTYTDTRGPELGYANLAVFYEACSFDCLYCQNWSFKHDSVGGPRRSAEKLADAVTGRTRCICFFGGDPSCQADHALTAARLAREKRKSSPLRICWETNGSVSRQALEAMVELSAESGGCIKFDLKAWNDALHRALCGVSNRRTLDNFEWVSRRIARRTDPPLLVASTTLVPGYIDADEVSGIARYIAGLDRSIPYALLAFHAAFEMNDLPTTSRRQAESCLNAAGRAGLTRVRLGNVHLLS